MNFAVLQNWIAYGISDPPAVYPASAPLPPVQQYSGGQPSLVGYSSPPYSSYRPVQGIGGNTGYGPASYGSGAPQTTVVIQVFYDILFILYSPFSKHNLF